MKQYLDILQDIMDNGDDRMDRTGVGTRAIFGVQSRYKLSNGFPAMTTKKLAWKAVVSELLWMIEGSGDERRLAEIRYGKPREELTDKTTIWTANAQADYWKPKAKFDGDLGRVYGVQWRSWNGGMKWGEKKEGDAFPMAEDIVVDQLAEVIENIKKNPYDRRHIIISYNVGEMDQMALPPCHIMFQFFVADGKLSCQMYQRSQDHLLGAPFNIASYALLTHMVAQVCDLGVGDFIHTTGDAHLYFTHFEQAKEQLTRTTLPLATLKLNPEIKNIDDFTMEDIELVGYQGHAAIKAPMAV